MVVTLSGPTMDNPSRSGCPARTAPESDPAPALLPRVATIASHDKVGVAAAAG